MIDPNYLPPELAAQILERDAELTASPLPDDVREILTILAEECGEVVQRCTKILRFGLTVNPWNGKHNREQLESELGDVAAMLRMLSAMGVISSREVAVAACKKLAAMRRPDGRLRHAKIPEGL